MYSISSLSLHVPWVCDCLVHTVISLVLSGSCFPAVFSPGGFLRILRLRPLAGTVFLTQAGLISPSLTEKDATINTLEFKLVF